VGTDIDSGAPHNLSLVVWVLYRRPELFWAGAPFERPSFGRLSGDVPSGAQRSAQTNLSSAIDREGQ